MTDYDARHDRYFYLKCSRCGKRVKGWLSIPDAKKPFYERESHECLECGHVYFRHDRELPTETAAKLRAELGEPYAIAQCPRCGGKVHCYSKRIDTASNKEAFRNDIDRVCEHCNSWHTESTTQLTLEFVNQQRSCEGLRPLPHFPDCTG
ncbi:MAG: hypothetical protein R6U93_04640 [Dehalococcoidia bacterium]